MTVDSYCESILEGIPASRLHITSYVHHSNVYAICTTYNILFQSFKNKSLFNYKSIDTSIYIPFETPKTFNCSPWDLQHNSFSSSGSLFS